MKKKLRFIAATLLICTLTLSGTSVTKTIASDSCIADEYTKIKNTNLDVGVNRMNVAQENDVWTCNSCGCWYPVVYEHNLEYDTKLYETAKESHIMYCTENKIHGTSGKASTQYITTQIHFKQYQIEVGQ